MRFIDRSMYGLWKKKYLQNAYISIKTTNFKKKDARFAHSIFLKQEKNHKCYMIEIYTSVTINFFKKKQQKYFLKSHTRARKYTQRFSTMTSEFWDLSLPDIFDPHFLNGV